MVGYYCDTYEDYVNCISKHFPHFEPVEPPVTCKAAGYVVHTEANYGWTTWDTATASAMFRVHFIRYIAKKVLPW